MLAPDTAVVVINDVLGDSEQPDWEYAIARIRARYFGHRQAAGTGIYSHRDVLVELGVLRSGYLDPAHGHGN